MQIVLRSLNSPTRVSLPPAVASLCIAIMSRHGTNKNRFQAHRTLQFPRSKDPWDAAVERLVDQGGG
jgi:hypothetical protein